MSSGNMQVANQSKPAVNRAQVQQLMDKIADPKTPQEDRLQSVGQVMLACQQKMFAALPKHVTPDRMIRVAMNCIRKTPKLLECAPVSLFAAITEAGTYGWELGGVLGHAYLVPYGKECTLIPGYKGLLDLGRRSGQISTYAMEVVHEGDTFSYELGDDPFVRHVPNDRDKDRFKKPITYVYAVVRFKDGGVQRSVWSSEKIDDHKQKYSQAWRRAESNGKKDSPWHENWAVMAKKTVIKDMFGRGLIPVSPEYRDMVDRAVKDEDGPQIDFADMMAIDQTPAPRLEESKEETVETNSPTMDTTDSTVPTFEQFVAEFNAAPDGVIPHRDVRDKYFGMDRTREWSPEENDLADKMLNDYLANSHANRGERSNKGKTTQKTWSGAQ